MTLFAMIKGNLNVSITHLPETSLPDQISTPHLQELCDLTPKFGIRIIAEGLIYPLQAFDSHKTLASYKTVDLVLY